MRRHNLPDWRTVAFVVLLMTAAPHLGSPLAFLSIVSGAFFLSSLDRARTPARAAIQGAWAALFYGLSVYFWGISALTDYLHVPFVVNLAIWLAATVLCQSQFIAFAAFYRWTASRIAHFDPARSPVGAPLLLGLAYAGFDWLAPRLMGDSIGHFSLLFPRLLQAAELVGVWGLSFLLVQAHASGYAAWLRRREGWRRWAVPIAAPALLWGAVAAYGEIRLGKLRSELASPAVRLSVLMLQPDIDEERKRVAGLGSSADARGIVGDLGELTRRGLRESPVDFVFWPETSYPHAYLVPRSRDEGELDYALDRLIEEAGVPLVFGGHDADEVKRYNSILFRYPEAMSRTKPFDLDIYRKRLLMPFGERIPGSEWLPFLNTLSPKPLDRMGEGEGPGVFELRLPRGGSVRVTPIICYEAVRSSYVLDGVRGGAELILNATDDSWAGAWGEPQLHLAMSIFRSVESRLPQLRATNNGISALILPTGELRSVAGWDEQAVLRAEVPIIGPSSTLLVRWGDWFGPAALLATALALLPLTRRGRIR